MKAVLFAIVLVVVVYASAEEKDDLQRRFKNWVFTAEKTTIKEPIRWQDRNDCYPDDLSMLPARLMDWFHLLRSERLREGVIDEEVENNPKCQSPVFPWFMKEFDVNTDKFLDQHELGEIEEIPYEHCIKRFFRNCDNNQDEKLSLDELCSCFAVEPPCFAAEKLYRMNGGEKPSCDVDGFFKPRQCNEGKCRCVDRYNQAVEGSDGLIDCPDNTDPLQIIFTGGEEELVNSLHEGK